jgi:hypothetical protein
MVVYKAKKAKYRKFNGKRYRRAIGHQSKTEAKNQAEVLRLAGLKARIVKEKTDVGTWYMVYVR